MKRFNLFFSINNAEKFKEIMAGFIKKHRSENDCTMCENKENCPIENNAINSRSALFADAETFYEIKELINHLYSVNFTETIILFDDKKDITYIYKGKGNLSEIKQKTLPSIIKMYETIKGYSVFFEIEDLRLTMMGSNTSILN